MSNETEYKSITREEAKELLKSGKARPKKGDGIVDIPSLIFSLSVFVIMVIASAVYFELYADTRIIKDFVPQPFPKEQYQSYFSGAEQIPYLAQKGNYNAIDSIIAPQLQNELLPKEQAIFLWLYSVELRLALNRYDQAQELAQLVQSNYSDDNDVLAASLWYKAHVYYYQKRFLDAHQQFATVGIMNNERYSAKAKEYQDEIYQLIRTDGINAIFD